MKQFLTLMKRDLSDNRGALIITPIVIACVILAIVFVSIGVGKFNFQGDTGFGFDSKNTANASGTLSIDGEKLKIYKDKNGVLILENKYGEKRPVAGNLKPGDTKEAADVFVTGSGIGSLLPIWVSLVTIIFVLSSGLFEERKDRSIMFWKSLPISDFKTVGAKFVSIVVGGVGTAYTIAIALHLTLMIIAFSGLSILGINVLNIGEIAASAVNFWTIVSVTLLGYLLWAMPIYAWFLAVGAYAPKAPFLAAVLPIALLPILAKIFAPGLVDTLLIPLQHITAQPMLENVKNSARTGADLEGISDMVWPFINGVTGSMAQPQFWIGLVIAGALLFGASEIRRRHAM
jgi:ABC-2 type transport system permease protein